MVLWLLLSRYQRSKTTSPTSRRHRIRVFPPSLSLSLLIPYLRITYSIRPWGNVRNSINIHRFASFVFRRVPPSSPSFFLIHLAIGANGTRGITRAPLHILHYSYCTTSGVPFQHQYGNEHCFLPVHTYRSGIGFIIVFFLGFKVARRRPPTFSLHF